MHLVYGTFMLVFGIVGGYPHVIPLPYLSIVPGRRYPDTSVVSEPTLCPTEECYLKRRDDVEVILPFQDSPDTVRNMPKIRRTKHEASRKEQKKKSGNGLEEREVVGAKSSGVKRQRNFSENGRGPMNGYGEDKCNIVDDKQASEQGNRKHEVTEEHQRGKTAQWLCAKPESVSINKNGAKEAYLIPHREVSSTMNINRDLLAATLKQVPGLVQHEATALPLLVEEDSLPRKLQTKIELLPVAEDWEQGQSREGRCHSTLLGGKSEGEGRNSYMGPFADDRTIEWVEVDDLDGAAHVMHAIDGPSLDGLRA
ncbi:hypothetical protein F5146DRAFT_1006204 [Armillaria mellea]|nr:hypothetical protein F5146DRAFT_1006204 [Armillaria mellea]